MTRGWRVVVLWGLWVCVLAALEIIFTPTRIELALLAGAGLGTVLVGALVLFGERRDLPPRPERAEPTALPTTSVPSMAIALGIAVAALGAEVGSWLSGLGAGVFVLGVFGVIREHRTARL